MFWFCLQVYKYMCICSHTFYCCHKPLPVCWAFAVLWTFPFFFFFCLLSIFFILIFETYCFFLFICLIFLLFFFHLQLIFNVYKSSLSTSIQLYISLSSFFYFFPFLLTYALVLFSLLYSSLGTLLQFCFLVCALVSFGLNW